MAPHEELLRKIGIVRNRWKQFVWLRGLAWVLGVTVVSLVAGLALADSTGISGWMVMALRLGLLAAVAVTAVKALVIPLRQTPTNAQLARFIEEKNPGLKDSLVSAVDAIQKARPEQQTFVQLLTKDVLEKTRNVRFADQVNKRKFSAFAALNGLFAVALIVCLYVASLFFPVGSAKLLAGLMKPPDVNAIQLQVTPGDQTVAKGETVTIEAVAMGFDPQRATVHLRYSNSTEWETALMDVTPQNVPTFRHIVFNLQEPLHYFVDAAGYRSKEFTIDVADLPRVEKMEYTYHYPSYTGLADKKEDNASDMVALKGTQVEVAVAGSQALSGGRVVFADGKSVPLQPAGEKMVKGVVTVDRNATFRIELTNKDRKSNLGLEEYSMEAVDDGKPIVEFTKPGRDTKATNVEEVFTELRAEDDFGVNQLELYFSVNGGPEQKVDLFSAKGEKPKEISAGHTFFLEEYNLQPGDLVTYYGKALDSHNPANSVSTDIYFVEVRPFGREYRQGQAGGGGGGGGGGEAESMESLLQRQKDIIAATHKLINNKSNYKGNEWNDNVHSVGANQAKAAEQTNTLVERMSRRGLVNEDKMIKQMADNLKSAIDQMNPAADQLKATNPDAAEPFEQKALQYLMRADALFTEIQITRGNGGGGGGGQQNARDLADLFELELDQNKNQYETVQRGENQQSSQDVDQMLQKLKELAERQQKLQQRRAQQQQAGGGGGGSDQMDMQDLQRETERLARQLDKLSRENNDRQMADAARALQQAAQNMQQQARGGSASQQQQAAQQAQEQLQRAQRLLNQGQGGSMEERLARAQEQAKKLADQQKQIADQTQQLAQNPGAAADARRRAQEINQQKDALSSELRSMTNELDSLSNNQENRDAAGKARAAANTIRGQQLQDRVETGRRLLENGTPQNGYYPYAAQNERAIEQALNDVQKQIGQAASAATNPEQKRLQEALNQAGDISQRVQSMLQRQRALQEGPNGEQNQRGQNSQQNQQGQNAQQNQQGQNGQQNQQGQNGQSGQNGQQNQQGQGGQNQQGQQAQSGQGGGQSGQQPGGRTYGGGQFPVNPNAQFQGSGGVYDPRQYARELQQDLNDIRELQRRLGQNDPLSRELDGIANSLQGLIANPRPGDPAAVARLADQVVDPFRGVEMQLSKALELLLSKDNIRSAQDDEIPATYQKAVEEYYKKLSELNSQRQ